MFRKNIYFFILISVFISAFSYEISKDPKLPERIILNLTDHKSSEMAVTWRTSGETLNSSILFSQATGYTDFIEDLDTIKAISTKLETGDEEIVYHHSVVLTSLKPQTKYIYRVGSPAGWSEWNHFSTAPTDELSFSFVWFGDPQNDIREHCSRVFREAFKTAPDAAFWLFSGDLMNAPEDHLYEEFFNAAGFIFRIIPSVFAPGNYDREYKIQDGEFVLNLRGIKQREDEVAKIWKSHFTLPENGLEGLEEASYYFDYAGARFIQINSNYMLSEQAVWLEEVLESNSKKWTIITFHHPFYSFGNVRNDGGQREAFQSVIDKYHVDLVLTGHDHVYTRSYKLVNSQVVPWDQPGTVYALSTSGPKQYQLNTQYSDLMAKLGDKLQLYQVIKVSHNTLEYKAYTANGNLFDSFIL